MSVHFDGCDDRSCAPGCPVWLAIAHGTGARTVCADTHHVAESALRPHGDGAAPTYEGGPSVEALTDADRRLRAETILDVMRGIAEIIVMSRCLKRLEALTKHRQGDPCLLDEALLLEKTDVRLEREHAACAEVIHGEGNCHSGMHQPSFPARRADRHVPASLAPVVERLTKAMREVDSEWHDEQAAEESRMRMHAGQLDGAR